MSKVADGFWNNVTATIDWCEHNYEVTYYIAEFWNTLSNLVMILLPVYSIYWSYKQKKSRKYKSYRMSNSVLACSVGIIFVGMGSWMFHMTLLYSMQLFDELPMIYSFSLIFYAQLDLLISANSLKKANIHATSKTRNFKPRHNIFLLVAMYCMSVTYIYVNIWTDPVFHQIAFGILVISNVVLAYRNAKIYKVPTKLFAMAALFFLIGFVFWNMDNHLCHYLHTYRQTLESVLSLSNIDLNKEFNLNAMVLNVIVVSMKTVSEFHSWWHVFTGYASFLGILFLLELDFEHHLKLNNEKSQDRPVISKYMGIVCYISAENEAKHTAKLNSNFRKKKI